MPPFRVGLGLGLSVVLGAAAPSRVVDTHVHVSNLSLGLNYTYPRSFPDLGDHGDWTLADFARESARARDAAGLSADRFGVVLMQLEQSGATRASLLAEAAWFEAVRRRCDALGADACGALVLGYVAGARLDEGAAATRAYVEALRVAAPRVVGVRQTLWKADDALFSDGDFVAAARALGEPTIRLPFELLVMPRQLELAAQLAAAAPNTTFNLEHLGYPNITAVAAGTGSGDDEARARARAAWDEWARGIDALAALPNVMCKLSGLPQTYGRPGWTARDFAPYVGRALRAFGAKRVNFAGNWFVLDEERWNGTYPAMWGAVARTLDALRIPDDDREEVYWRAATRLYGLA